MGKMIKIMTKIGIRRWPGFNDTLTYILPVEFFCDIALQVVKEVQLLSVQAGVILQFNDVGKGRGRGGAGGAPVIHQCVIGRYWIDLLHVGAKFPDQVFGKILRKISGQDPAGECACLSRRELIDEFFFFIQGCSVKFLTQGPGFF